MKFRKKMSLVSFLAICSGLSLGNTAAFSSDLGERDPEELNSKSMFPFTEEEMASAESISVGGIKIPSETETTKFIQEEGLNLQTTSSGLEAFGKTTPRIGLSIDGGGIRGVMPALWLRTLKTAYEEEGDHGIDEPLHKIFDYVGGTSIGGIVSLGVAAGLEPDTIVELFNNEANRKKIFSAEGRKLVRFFDFFGLFGYRYSANNLVTLLKQTFGEDKKLSDLETNILVTACTVEGHPWIFKKEEDDNKNYKLWEVARSTSAAPTYFEAYQPLHPIQAHRPQLVDGGIWVNNPSTLVTASIVKEFHGGSFKPNKVHILSLGTGDTNVKGLPKSSEKLAAGEIIEALMSSHSRGNHMLMSQLLGENYHRVNAEMDQTIDLADTSNKAYAAMQGYAAQQEHTDKINTFVEQTAGIIRKKLEQD